MVNQEGVGRRGQILDAALHVMAEHGFRGASIKRIAERAGLKSPALIYWYFKDKHALLEAILQRMSPFLSTVAEADLSLDDPPDQVLPRLITASLCPSSRGTPPSPTSSPIAGQWWCSGFSSATSSGKPSWVGCGSMTRALQPAPSWAC
jgi:AcrR family transcriptional regulator